MEEIVVALRETKRSADRMLPVAVDGRNRGGRGLRVVDGPTDLTDLRDGEIERLLSENTRLNARVVALLKVIERDQAYHAEVAAEVAAEAEPPEMDGATIQREVRAALEAELSPVLLVLLRLLQKRFADSSPGDGNGGGKEGPPAASEPAPSDWIVDIMRKLDVKAPAPIEAVAARDAMPRRPKLRQCVADVLAAFGLESHAAAARQRFTSPDERT
jgi:hypothetical protein